MGERRRIISIAWVLWIVVAYPSTTWGDFIDIAVGSAHACALADDGRVWCWGAARQNGQDSDTTVPAPLPGLKDIRRISAGHVGTCAIDSKGAAVCWGFDFEHRVVTAKPYPVDTLPPVAEIAVGYTHFCARSSQGEVYCWGENPRGELGDGSTTSRPRPVKVSGISEATSIGAGVSNTCVVETGGTVGCWGTDAPENDHGRGRGINSVVPEEVPGLTGMESLANGRNSVCGLQRGGRVVCWGTIIDLPQTRSGLAGVPEWPPMAAISIFEAKNRIIAVDLGLFLGCAVDESGAVYCWSFETRVPRKVPGLDGVMRLSIGADNGCAIMRDKSIRCWDDARLAHKPVDFPGQ